MRVIPIKISAVLFTVFLAFNQFCTKPQNNSAFTLLQGYWEGEFMPGNNLTLVLDFYMDNGIEMYRVVLFQNDIQIQDDLLK